MREIPLKQFCHEEAKRRHLQPATVHEYIKRGQYPNLLMRHINRRVVLVSGSRSDKAVCAAQPPCPVRREVAKVKIELARVLGLLNEVRRGQQP